MKRGITTPCHTNVAERICGFNRDRDPERLRLKYKAMSMSPFAFFRGTCHLFYEDWPRTSELDSAPDAWLCGDLHLENFGSYKGDNRLVYFDINDFDESALAPCTWDITRLLTSLIVGTRGAMGLGLKRRESLELCEALLNAYTQALGAGKARWVERETAGGMIAELLSGLRDRTRKVLLAGRIKKGGRKLRIDGKRTLQARPEDRTMIRAYDAWRRQQGRVFGLLDHARRIAGTGSLGLPREVLLVEGKGSPSGQYLLDLKEARSSALTPYLRTTQPKWPTEAERIVTSQRRIQAISPAFLQTVVKGSDSYVLRELQPTDDRLDLEQARGREKVLEPFVASMGCIVAWAHLRTSGRQGSATADELIGFSETSATWHRRVLEYAATYSEVVERDWREFRVALRDDFFKDQTD